MTSHTQEMLVRLPRRTSGSRLTPRNMPRKASSYCIFMPEACQRVGANNCEIVCACLAKASSLTGFGSAASAPPTTGAFALPLLEARW